MIVHDATPCALGEGPLWHPERQELFWFDILGKRLHRKGQHWQFDEHVSAAGWVDETTLIIASQTALSRFDIETGQSDVLIPLEADDPVTRSNDGRADPWGGFWIGSMGLNAEPSAGAIWRYYRGELRKVVPQVTISNSICFAPDRSMAYYTDTPTQQIMAVALDPETGWPQGAPHVHIDLTGTAHKADGAVVDTEGCLWTAQWGSARMARYDPSGKFIAAIEVPALQATCPAFGGEDFKTLHCTSALVGLDAEELANRPLSGQTFEIQTDVTGQAEHRVILPD